MQPRHHAVNEHKGSHCNSITYALSQSAVKQKLTSDLKQLSFRWPTGRSVPLSGGDVWRKKSTGTEKFKSLSDDSSESARPHSPSVWHSLLQPAPWPLNRLQLRPHTVTRGREVHFYKSDVDSFFLFFLTPATFCTTLMTQSKIETLTLSCMGNVSNEDQKEHISNSKRQITDLILTTKTVNY